MRSCSPPVLRRISRRRNRSFAFLIADRHAGRESKWNHARPDRQGIVRSVVFGRTASYLRGNFLERQAQNARGFQLLFVGLAGVIPAPRNYFFSERLKRSEFFFRRFDQSRFAERHYR